MLQSLELFGFKSFADRTLFEFSPGISCVVGPNGSGKSNVVDAIKWILGDQSAKSLRGQDMLDVIFNGSAGRRPSGFAEATLAFDNSQHLLPTEATEVKIGRRLYQSGDSEYLLNGAVVRLKDIRDLFMGTGAGTAAYSIIEQGRVDQILQANPATRRFVFEEASGISKFKARRVDAERRLERVAQNLVRLTDMVDQAEAQLNSTRSQASKAARFRELSQELKQAWTGLAADDTRQISQAHEQLQADQERLQAERQVVETAIARIDEQKLEADRHLAAAEDRFLRSEQAASELRERLGGEAAAIRHQGQRLSDLEEDLAQVRNQSLVLRQQSAFAVEELAELQRLLEEHRIKFEESQQQISRRELHLEELATRASQRESALVEQQGTLRRQEQELTQTADRLVQLRSALGSLRREQDTLAERASTRSEQLAQLQMDLATHGIARDEAQARVDDLQSEVRRLEQERLRLDKQYAATDQQLRDQRERRGAAQARWVVLDELERRQEGIALGTRDLLIRARTESSSPWDTVLGLVRDLLDVPLDLAPIIDAALAERAQWIALSRLDDMLEHLNQGRLVLDGRVGFLSLTAAVEQLPAATDELRKMPGVYGRADQLVQELPGAEGLAARVLGDVWIVESLAVAQQVLDCGPSGIRAATLQGEVLGPRGQLLAGLMPHEVSIVSRKSELRQLRNEILQLEKAIESAMHSQAILAASLQSRSTDVDAQQLELSEATRMLAMRSSEFAIVQRDAHRLQTECDELSTRSKTVQAQLETSVVEEQQLERTHHELQQVGTTLAAAVRQEEQQLAEIETLLRDTRQQIRLEQVELTGQADRLRSLQSTQARLEKDQRQREQQAGAASRRYQELKESIRKTMFQLLAGESRHASLALEHQQAQGASSAEREVREELRIARSQFAALDQAEQERRRALLDELRRVEFEIQKLQHQAQSLQARIQEEFQISLDELLESGASAYHAFLRERYGENVLVAPAAEEGSETTSDVERPRWDAALVPSYAEVREELEARVDRLRRKLKSLGSVNTEALEHLEELEQRHTRLAAQLQDLLQAKATLEDIIRRINVESRRLFMETFEVIRKHFQELFRKLFGGGDADIILENAEDVLECGIDIVARPPGKELRSISLLSGGEKTMTAVGLLFAMFKSKPSPYCILDEVDAALDEANVDRYVSVLKEFVSMTQFVVITHRKRTMTAANVLYGVTMEQAGVSKKISVRFEDVRDNGEIRKAA